MATHADESTNRLQRWRLVLGTEEPPPEEAPEETKSDDEGEYQAQENSELSERMQKVDETLDTLYGDPQRRGNIGDSAPYAVRWLADVREYFSQPTAQMLQQEAWERFDWKALVQEPKFLESLEPSVDLVALLVSLKSLLPSQTRETAREVIRKVIEDLQERWKLPLQQALYGGMTRQRNLRPRKLNEINWYRTILKNLKYYQPSYKTVIPEQLIGWKSQHKQHLHLILCVDQSASMQQSVVHAGILGAVLAGMPSLTTKLLLFDTQVIDVSDQLNDPIELLFGVQLGGGTHITKALQRANSLIDLPEKTILFLISDLYEGQNTLQVVQEMQVFLDRGVLPVVLLALDDKGGTPAHHQFLAQELARRGVAVLSCTPDAFPALFGEVLKKRMQ